MFLLLYQLGIVKSFEIFWKRETHFDSSRWSYLGHESDDPILDCEMPISTDIL